MKKNITILLITILSLLSSQQSYANIAEGEVGTCIWYITDENELVIAPADSVSGNLPENGWDFIWDGKIDDSCTNAPWGEYRGSIFSAKIMPGVNATSCKCMFYGLNNMKNVDLSNFNTQNVTDMRSMFARCSSLTSLDLSNFNTQNVTSMWNMFYGCSALTSLDLSNFNTQNVTEMDTMFWNCSSLTSLDLSNFNTENVWNMGAMFDGCSSLTSFDLSNFNTQNVTDMNSMFSGCSALTSLDLSNFNTQNVTDMNSMFYGCSALTSLELSNFNTQNVTNMWGMFSGCSSLTSLDLSNFNTENVKNMGSMFAECSALTSLDLSNFNTQNVTYMGAMFWNCSSLTSLDLSNFNTQNVTNMRGMLFRCSSLTSLNLTNFSMESVTEEEYMANMFTECPVLTTIISNRVNPSVLKVGTFDSFDNRTNCTLVVPAGSEALYAAADGWNELSKINDVTPDVNPQIPEDAIASGETGTCIWYITSENELVIAPADGVRGDLPEEGWEPSNYDGAVQFGNPVIGSAQASDSSKKWYTGAYGVFGYEQGPSDFESYSNDTSLPDFLYNQKVEYSETGKKWEYSPLKYYSNNSGAMHSFFAYAPYSNDIRPVFSAGQPPRLRYYNSDNYDLLYATPHVDMLTPKTKENLEFEFKHALSQLSVQVAPFSDASNDSHSAGILDDNTYIELKSVRLVGNIPIQGLLSLEDGSWTLERTDVYSHLVNDSYELTKSNNGTYKMVGDNIIIIPTANKIEVLFDIIVEDPLNPDMRSIVTNNILSNESFTFEQGKAYVLSIDLGMTNAKFTSTEVEWLTQKTDSVAPALNTESRQAPWGEYSNDILSAKIMPGVNAKSCSNMFYGLSNLNTIDLSDFDTQNVTNMHGMFDGCSSLTSLDLSGFNTQNVTDMNSMFSGCSSLTSIISDCETPSILQAGTFRESFENRANCTLIVPAGTKELYAAADGWNELGKIDDGTPDVNPQIPEDAIASGETGTCIWYITSENELVIAPADGVSGDLPEWGYLYDAPWGEYSEIIFSTKIMPGVNAKSCRLMFYGLDKMTSADLSGLNTDNLTDMRGMFQVCSSLTSLDLSNFNTAKVTDMSYLFSDCSSLTSLDISNFDTKSVYLMDCMFNDCSSLTSLDLGNFNTNNVAVLSHLFSGCSSLTSLDLSNFNTQNVTKMRRMFMDCSSLTSLDLSNFNTENVTEMWGLFEGCSSLSSINLSSFNTQNVTDMGYMFRNCSSLTSLDLSNINTENVTYAYMMLYGCSSLTTLDLSNFNTENVTEMSWMFSCPVLTTIISNNETPSPLKVGTFSESFDNRANCTLVVPTGTKSLYAAADGWKELGIIKEDSYGAMTLNLTSDEPFYNSEDYTADVVTYTRYFSKLTQKETSAGWETIVLPFDVQNVMTADGRLLAPFGSTLAQTGSALPFWLAELKDGQYVAATSIRANTPYIISMPNGDDIYSKNRISGNVIFFAHNATVYASNGTQVKQGADGFAFVPTYEFVEAVDYVYAINDEVFSEGAVDYQPGSVFVHNSRTVRPFEAYMQFNQDYGFAPRFLPVMADETDGIVTINPDTDTVSIYDLSGRKIDTMRKGVNIVVKDGKVMKIKSHNPL